MDYIYRGPYRRPSRPGGHLNPRADTELEAASRAAPSLGETQGGFDQEEQVREPRRADQSLSIVYLPIAEVKLDPRNPRLHSPNQIRQIARSIETFGFNVPVLIDARGQLKAGHGRVLAAQLLGMTHVPTIRLEHLTEAQTRAFMIADNRLTENSVWDDHLLADQLKELSLLNLDFSLEVTGFELGEIDMRIKASHQLVAARPTPLMRSRTLGQNPRSRE